MQGKGKDVLMLHGYLSNKESFYYQTKFLSQHFKVTVPDMPGFGASFALDQAYSVGNCIFTPSIGALQSPETH